MYTKEACVKDAEVLIVVDYGWWKLGYCSFFLQCLCIFSIFQFLKKPVSLNGKRLPFNFLTSNHKICCNNLGVNVSQLWHLLTFCAGYLVKGVLCIAGLSGTLGFYPPDASSRHL